MAYEKNTWANGDIITKSKLDHMEQGIYDANQGSGVTDELKDALLACFENVAWIDEDGQDYYDGLYAALYDTTWQVTNTLSHCSSSNAATSVTKNGSYSATITAASGYTLTGATVSITMGGTDITSTAYSNGTISIASVTGALVISVSAAAKTVSSISAVYTQSGTVSTNTSLDSLKSDLVVTATYSDTTTEVVPDTDYTLSGTLEVGTSTVTVSYGGQTTTFTVTVTEPFPLPTGYTKYDYVRNKSTSGVYINTGISYSYCAPTYKHNIKFRVPSYPTAETQLYGARGARYGGTWDTEYLLSMGTTGVLRMGFCGANQQNLYTPQEDELIEFETYNKSISVNGDVVKTATSTGTYDTVTAKITLFGYGWGTSGNGTYVNTGVQFKIYGYSIEDENGDYIAYLTPCTNASDQAGFYEHISGTFLTSGTPANLECGNDAT